MALNYFLPKMLQALNHNLVLYKTRNSSESLELLKSEMCFMNVGECVFVSGVYAMSIAPTASPSDAATAL